MSSKHVLMAKVRARIRREHAAAEDAEIEGGELNLVPYLDIVTNTVIFMLATTALTIALANINVTAPRYVEQQSGSQQDDQQDDKPKLNLTVGITYSGFTVAGAAGVLPRIDCKSALQNDRCPAFIRTRVDERGDKEAVWVDQYDYKQLQAKIREVKLFKDATGKQPWRTERSAVITADRRIPYQVLVRTMDTLRGAPTRKCDGEDGCYFDQVVLSAGVQ